MNREITRPTLVLDKETCLRNISTMAAKAGKHGLVFRPHFKTHQSKTIGNWFRDYGVERITVSSVEMAAYFAEDGWKDITLAFPVNLREKQAINDLASRICLNLLVSSAQVIPLLDRILARDMNVFLEIDTGYGRSGFDAGNPGEIMASITQLGRTKHLRFIGFLSHTGQTYHAGSAAGVMQIHDNALEMLQDIVDSCDNLAERPIVSMGDTPSCSLADNFRGVDEIRPGNFVFYDRMQQSLGSCSETDIAVRLVCPVTACYPQRNQVVIHGGAVHLSRERLDLPGGIVSFGAVSAWEGTHRGRSWEGCRLSSLTQEHGIIILSDEKNGTLNPGDLVSIIPVHSCLTADAMGGYLTTDGEQIDHMRGKGRGMRDKR